MNFAEHGSWKEFTEIIEDFTARVVVTPSKGQPMPKTIEYYKAQQEREGKLILEMKSEISDLKVRNDRLEKKLLKRS